MTCYSVPPPNKKSKILKAILLFLLIWQAVLACAKGYWQSRFDMAGEIIALVILWVAFNSLNYCNCVLYIFLCMVNSFSILISLATKIEDGIVLTDFSNFEHRIFIIISLVSIVFYIVSCYFVFQAYREFKGIALDILLATHNHELSAISHYNSPSKKFNSPSSTPKNQIQNNININENFFPQNSSPFIPNTLSKNK